MDEKEWKKKIKERQKKHEEWESSIEGILYSIGSMLGGVLAQSEHDEYLIAKVLQQVPKDIRGYIIENVIFILAGDQSGIIHRLRFNLDDERVKEERIPQKGKDDIIMRYIEQDFIILTFTPEMSDEYKTVTIAHEIAHTYLNHGDVNCSGGEKHERAADDLIESWGFSRAYKSYDSFKR